MEGRALDCLGRARLAVNLGAQVITWDFIVAEIGEDKGILGNDFTMAHRLMVRPHEAAVYLPVTEGGGREDMGERLPCTIRSIAEVKAITEEAFTIRAVEWLTLVPCTMSQVSVIVSTTNAKGTVMVEAGPWPPGPCPVRLVAEEDRDTKIWLANLGSEPVEIEGEQVVAMA